jgi:two-component sensor histidine kinase
VSPPARTGFGSRLVEGVLPAELKGQVRMAYDPAGVTCEIVAPLSSEWEDGRHAQ